MIEIDDLCDIREAIEIAAQPAMIETGPAMQHDKSRLLAHAGSVRRELRAHDIEENLLSNDGNEHRGSITAGCAAL